MFKLIVLCPFVGESVGAHTSLWVVNIFVFLGVRSGLSVVFALQQRAILLLLWMMKKWFINIFSCIDVKLEVSFINPTLK